MIRKKGSKWVVLSESKGPGGKRKTLGTYSSKRAAQKRLRQVEYFKRQKG